MFIDPLVYIAIAPFPMAALAAQSAMIRARLAARRDAGAAPGRSGLALAREVLRAGGAGDATVRVAPGLLADTFDPGRRTLGLSVGVAEGRTGWARGCAAAEAGHALGSVLDRALARARRPLLVGVWLASGVGWIVLPAGLLLDIERLAARGAGLLAGSIALAAVTVPIERAAGRRALGALADGGAPEASDPAVAAVVASRAWRWLAAAPAGPIPGLVASYRSALATNRAVADDRCRVDRSDAPSTPNRSAESDESAPAE